MSDHYYLERTGPKYENQSTTEFKFCTHGSEVRTGRDQRVFFFRSFVHDRGFAAHCRHKTKQKLNKKPSGTQGIFTVTSLIKLIKPLLSIIFHCMFVQRGDIKQS